MHCVCVFVCVCVCSYVCVFVCVFNCKMSVLVYVYRVMVHCFMLTGKFITCHHVP